MIVQCTCGRLLAIICPKGHEHRFPEEGVAPDIAGMLVEIGLRCVVPECKLPISVDEVSHGICSECLAKAYRELDELEA